MTKIKKKQRSIRCSIISWALNWMIRVDRIPRLRILARRPCMLITTQVLTMLSLLNIRKSTIWYLKIRPNTILKLCSFFSFKQYFALLFWLQENWFLKKSSNTKRTTISVCVSTSPVWFYTSVQFTQSEMEFSWSSTSSITARNSTTLEVPFYWVCWLWTWIFCVRQPIYFGHSVKPMSLVSSQSSWHSRFLSRYRTTTTDQGPTSESGRLLIPTPLSSSLILIRCLGRRIRLKKSLQWSLCRITIRTSLIIWTRWEPAPIPRITSRKYKKKERKL